MRLLVCIKPVYDSRLPLTVSGGRVSPLSSHPVFEISPASRGALEWGVRLKAEFACEISTLSMGAQEAESVLRTSLALGADRAVQAVAAADAAVEPWLAADCVSRWSVSENFDLILCGDGAFGPLLAEVLGWVQVTRVVHLFVSESGELRATRLLERGGREVVAAALPAVITFNPTGCEPTYLSQLRLQRSASLPVERISFTVSALSGFPALQQVELGPARPRPRRMPAPAANMSAAQRMSFLMGAGQGRSAAREDRFVEGDPDQAADKILQFLQERGFV